MHYWVLELYSEQMKVRTSKTVYFVRHGQSIDNALPVFQSIASPLSEKGKRQAESIADRLSKIDFETLLASSVERAKETAQHISSKTGKEIVFSNLFVERIKPDELDGKPWADEQANKVWRSWEESLYTSGKHVSNGENYDDIINRVDKALEFLLKRPESKLAVVTHGYFLRATVIRILLGDNLSGDIMRRFQKRASIANTAVTVLKYGDAFEEDFAWRLWTFNDHSHFAE